MAITNMLHILLITNRHRYLLFCELDFSFDSSRHKLRIFNPSIDTSPLPKQIGAATQLMFYHAMK